jgi:hypothetical protein
VSPSPHMQSTKVLHPEIMRTLPRQPAIDQPRQLSERCRPHPPWQGSGNWQLNPSQLMTARLQTGN